MIEASKQCARPRLMTIDSPTPWASVVDSFCESERFLANAQGFPASQLPEIPGDLSVILAVGPEGGFTPAERDQAAIAGLPRTSWAV